MSVLKLKIDVSGTVGDAAWREINQFDQIQSADFGPQFGSGGGATIRQTLRMPRANGSEPKSGCRHRFWRSTPCRTIWSRSASSMRTWSRRLLLYSSPGFHAHSTRDFRQFRFARRP